MIRYLAVNLFFICVVISVTQTLAGMNWIEMESSGREQTQRSQLASSFLWSEGEKDSYVFPH